MQHALKLYPLDVTDSHHLIEYCELLDSELYPFVARIKVYQRKKLAVLIVRKFEPNNFCQVVEIIDVLHISHFL